MLLRSVKIIVFSGFIASLIIYSALFRETGKVTNNALVNLAERDIKIMRDALEVYWYTYNLDGIESKDYSTKKYGEFRGKVAGEWNDKQGYMPFELPEEKNFVDFSYRGTDDDFHIILQARDKKGTLVHATRKAIWRE